MKIKIKHHSFTAALALLAIGSANNRADTFYVSNYGGSSIAKFDSTGTPIALLTVGVNAAQGLALDSIGNLFAANIGDGTVVKFDPSGVSSLFSSSGLLTPTGAAIDQSGNLYVANYDGQTVTRFDSAGNPSVFAGSGLNYPAALAFDAAGNLYVSNHNGNTIRKFSPTGTDLGDFANSGLNGPEAIAFDQAGNLYAANFGLYNTDFSVSKFSPAGVYLGAFISSGLNYPSGLAFDSAGNLYVVNHGSDSINKYSSAGAFLGVFANTGLNGPAFIVSQPDAAAFDFQGFLPPIAGADSTGGTFAHPLRAFKIGSTIPVKFAISTGGSTVSTGSQTLQAIKYSNASTAGAPLDAIPQGASTDRDDRDRDSGDQFRYTGGHWQFNLDTKATGMNVGIWELRATLSDGSQHTVWIQLK